MVVLFFAARAFDVFAGDESDLLLIAERFSPGADVRDASAVYKAKVVVGPNS